ncbi:MAG: cytosine permease [Conexivisphaerales archaeon]
MVERVSIQHIPEESRHGRPFSIFTLWLASNLTIADYALGLLLYGLPWNSIITIVIVGNIVGSFLLGLSVAMGPKMGYPQMMISQGTFGRLGNKPFALLNWISTVGWYTVNTILGSYSLKVLSGLTFIQAALILSIVQAIIAIYGHDIIHKFERGMAVVLGLLFVGGIIFLYPRFALMLHAYETTTHISPFTAAIVFGAIFSYIMSWSPYASDYSRYLDKEVSIKRVILYSVAGGALASAISEIFGTMVYIVAGNPRLNPIQAAGSLGSMLALITISAVALGALSANVLNLYTNSLSAVTFYQKARRIQTVIIAVILGFILAVIGGTNFETFYEDFLLTLDYWITPWLGIMIVSFYIKKLTFKDVESPTRIKATGLLAYVIGILVSLPFVNLSPYGIHFKGFIVNYLGGADISYFISFVSVIFFYLIMDRISRLHPIS